MDYLSALVMVTIERAKELLNMHDLTDIQVEEIRNAFKNLAEIIYEKWMSDTHLTTKTYENDTNAEQNT
ncbi:hypothetical protein BH11PAT2_BH11PAT2_04920 [soil metagenome]